ncbi:unnamed protein product [Sphenostylis stenocarpa]|uniref:Uncharacterized protein n=1 Tax=Sphenostylis stenocarpa TaxID=92480 RepID=A0AA86S4X5_9FABA|nr:unnamed protein product [Sphenostylis stenocarpa]
MRSKVTLVMDGRVGGERVEVYLQELTWALLVRVKSGQRGKKEVEDDVTRRVGLTCSEGEPISWLKGSLMFAQYGKAVSLLHLPTLGISVSVYMLSWEYAACNIRIGKLHTSYDNLQNEVEKPYLRF